MRLHVNKEQYNSVWDALESERSEYLEEQSDALKEIKHLTSLVHERDYLIEESEFDLNFAMEYIYVILVLCQKPFIPNNSWFVSFFTQRIEPHIK